MNRIQSNDHRIGIYDINRYLRLALMIKYSSKTMNVMD